MFEYEVKRLPELGWAVAVALLTFGAQLVGTTDPKLVTDWRAYALAAAAGAGRVVLAALLSWIGIAGKTAPPPAP